MNEGSSHYRTAYTAGKRGMGSPLLFTLLIVAAIIIYTFASGGGSITSQCDEYLLGVSPSSGDAVFIYYDQMKSVELRDRFDYGTKISSTVPDEKGITVGTYSNGEFDEYTAMCVNKTTKYIIIEYSEGILVFNCQTNMLTDTQYEDLLNHVDPSIVK